MKKKLSLMAATFVLTGSIMAPMGVFAADNIISIDGSFSDWKQIEHEQIGSENWWYENMSLVYDDKYVYLHVTETKSDVWETRFPTMFFKVNGEIKNIVLTRSDYSNSEETVNVQVRNSWYQEIPYASGKTTRSRSDGKNEWEVAIPIQALLAKEGQEPNTEPKVIDASGVGVCMTSNGEINLVGKKLTNEIINDEPVVEEPEQPVDPGLPDAPEDLEDGEAKDNVDEVKVVIDGYYDDWENAPKTDISYGSWNWNGSYILEYHKGSMLIDDKNLYIHVKMCETYHQQIPIDMLNLTINGETQSFIIRYEKEDGTIDWDSSIYNLSEGIHTNLGFYKNGDANVSLGDAAITIKPNHEGDCFEVAVDLEALLKYYSIDKKALVQGAEIKFYSPNIGPEEVVIVGTSTNPYLGILLALGAVGGATGAGIYMKRKKSTR